MALSISGDSSKVLVLHVKHGQGTVLLTDGDTSVVRFAHGIEQVLSCDLTPVASVTDALASANYLPSLEIGLRVQADIIESVNNAWGVFTRSKISLLPHQLWVCHRAIRQWPIRLLIADDVGMGKTIEAGLLLWPLLANRKVQRVLILCPATLVSQWQIRLKQMFDIRAATYHSDLDNDRTDFWGIHQIVVASLPTLRADRNGRHDRLLDAPTWDIVIVDEAHHLYADDDTGKTLGFELLEQLGRAGKIISSVFFTGTPHRGKSFGFWSLMSLLDSEIFGPRFNEGRMLQSLPRYLIRNAKQKATDMKGNLLFKPVIQHPEKFQYSIDEARFYDLMSEFIVAGKAYATSLDRSESGQVILVLIALQKLASSSISAVAAALRTRISRLRVETEKSRKELDSIGLDSESEADISLNNWINEEKRARLKLMENEGRYLDDLLAAASLVTSETRIARIIEIVNTRFPLEPVLLFTEYKRTQALMVSALMAEFGEQTVGFINGDDRLEGVSLPSGRIAQLSRRREDVCDAFNSGRIRFLVATEAGGEGIDLQERCSALIHVDLPWNPMRLHQRVGRLNRYGQQRAVQVVSLRNPATVEAMIWEKLEQKLGSIMRALGTAMDEPEDLMQLVLGMSGDGFFDRLFGEATTVPEEKLASWFDEKLGTLGGESAISVVQDLVGHAQSFDLSDLKDVPPVDLPDLLPFFQSSLVLNHRRPKVEDLTLSFKTPESWLVSHAIRKSYDRVVFDRKAHSSFDLLGVGHPLIERALHQASRLPGGACVVDGIDAPVLVLDVSSRITDGSNPTKRAIVGVTGNLGAFTVLRDWQLLRLLNRCVLKSEKFSGPLDVHGLARWHSAASDAAEQLIDSLALDFESRIVTEIALILTMQFEAK